MKAVSCNPEWGTQTECEILYDTYLDLYSYCYTLDCGPAWLTWLDCEAKAEGCWEPGSPDPCLDEGNASDEICGFDDGAGGNGGSSGCRTPDKPVDPVISDWCMEAVDCGWYDTFGECTIFYSYDLEVYSYCGGEPCGNAFLSYIDCFNQLPDVCSYTEDDCLDEQNAMDEVCGFNDGTGGTGTGGSSGVCP